ncbi:dehydrodolichyl diphosphate synthase complex subunit Nus1-like [Amphiura filiformis]|uniref:dehydrodolichyl diphosphate synthase complex subunit Nus1-like n=1 Tax=Amphiura filiformis TaxID=82378 RepID=UPI003B2102CE
MAFYDGIVLWCVHTILTLKTLLFTWLFRTWKPVETQYRKVAYSRCCNDSKLLQKIPIHLGLVIAENQISYVDIANLVVWCMAVGISYISVYDTRGILKKSHSSLSSEIEKKRDDVLGHEKEKFTYQLHHSLTTSKTDQITESKKKSHILLLSAQDGRPDIVQAAKGYCQQVYEQLTKSNAVDVGLIDSLLQATSGFPDPDLLIRFGTTSSLLGYLPWQIRLTEILSIPTHWNIDYKSFMNVLHNYAGTQQRFGK